eukprot:1186929-Prorocentrum_minimum.AAC.1
MDHQGCGIVVREAVRMTFIPTVRCVMPRIVMITPGCWAGRSPLCVCLCRYSEASVVREAVPMTFTPRC